VKATKFIVNDLGDATDSERAGKNNDWPDIDNTSLSIILSHTQKWRNLTSEEKTNFQKELKLSWGGVQILILIFHIYNSQTNSCTQAMDMNYKKRILNKYEYNFR
jgi:hypothetical protein